jgi:hypothetical protein
MSVLFFDFLSFVPVSKWGRRTLMRTAVDGRDGVEWVKWVYSTVPGPFFYQLVGENILIEDHVSRTVSTGKTELAVTVQYSK